MSSTLIQDPAGTTACAAAASIVARTQQAPRVFFLPWLDALRFLAFTMVFVFHAFPQAPEVYTAKGMPEAAALALTMAVHACGFGVDLFFVVSAYLITTLLRAEQTRTSGIALRAFYIRRALRIWPLYYAFLLGGFAVQAVLSLDALAPSALATYLVFLGNWPWPVPKPWTSFGILWSLCVEEQFYLTLPLVMARLSLPALRRTALALLGVAALARLAYALADADYLTTWTSTITRLDPIALGILLALVPRPRVPARFALVPLCFVGLVSVGYLDRVLAPRYGLVPGFSVAALLCATIVAAALDTSSVPVGRVFGAILFLGKISFGLYVFHATMQEVALALLPPPASTAVQLARIALAYAATIALALVSYRLLERPILAFKDRFATIATRGP